MGFTVAPKAEDHTNTVVWTRILVSLFAAPRTILRDKFVDVGFLSTGIMAIARILTVKSAALSLDVTWDSSPKSYFSVIEVNVGITCACVITLRPLLAHALPSWVKPSYGNQGYYGDKIDIPGTKKSSRDTMTHASHGIYGLADLEVDRVLNGSQEGLTTPKQFEPAHFSAYQRQHMPRMSTSITGGRSAGFDGRSRAGDIIVTRETTIKEETRRMSSPGSPGSKQGDDGSWLNNSTKELSETSST